MGSGSHIDRSRSYKGKRKKKTRNVSVKPEN